MLEFEQVLSFDNLPPDLHEQAEIYARAARDYKAGRRLSAFGYAETGGGYYRENVTRSTNAAGGDPDAGLVLEGPHRRRTGLHPGERTLPGRDPGLPLPLLR